MKVTQSCPGLKPDRLLCPWNSPGKNTRVGSHFLLQGNLPDPGIKHGSPASQADSLLSLCCVLSCSVMSDSLRPHGLQPARLLCPWGFSRQEYQSGLPYPSPGDLHNTGIKPGLPHCRRILYYVSYTREPSLPSESPAKDKRELLIR